MIERKQSMRVEICLRVKRIPFNIILILGDIIFDISGHYKN